MSATLERARGFYHRRSAPAAAPRRRGRHAPLRTGARGWGCAVRLRSIWPRWASMSPMVAMRRIWANAWELTFQPRGFAGLRLDFKLWPLRGGGEVRISERMLSPRICCSSASSTLSSTAGFVAAEHDVHVGRAEAALGGDADVRNGAQAWPDQPLEAVGGVGAVVLQDHGDGAVAQIAAAAAAKAAAAAGGAGLGEDAPHVRLLAQKRGRPGSPRGPCRARVTPGGPSSCR